MLVTCQPRMAPFNDKGQTCHLSFVKSAMSGRRVKIQYVKLATHSTNGPKLKMIIRSRDEPPSKFQLVFFFPCHHQQVVVYGEITIFKVSVGITSSMGLKQTW